MRLMTKTMAFKLWKTALKDFLDSDHYLQSKEWHSFLTEDDKYYYHHISGAIYFANKNEGFSGKQLIQEHYKTLLFVSRLEYAINTSVDACLYPKEALKWFRDFEKETKLGLPFQFYQSQADCTPAPTEEPKEYQVAFIADKPN